MRTTFLVATTVVLVACGSGDATLASTAVVAAVSNPAAVAPVKVAPDQAAVLLAQQGATVIDVRTAAEFAAAHLTGAVNDDVEGGQFSTLVAGLDRHAAYAVYCHSGRRSALAAQAMAEMGFTTVYDLGGLGALQAAGIAVVAG